MDTDGRALSGRVGKPLGRMLAGLLGLILCLALPPTASGAEPAVDAGLAWLAAQLQPDHSIATAADLATPYQSTAEAHQTLLALAPAALPDASATLAYLDATHQVGTESLTRLLVAQVLSGGGVEALLAELWPHQTTDGGFGWAPGYQSTVLDTAQALAALHHAGADGAQGAAAAVGYLLAAQGGEGGWADPGGASGVYESALALHALWSYRHRFALTSVLDRAQAWLLAQRADDRWAEPFATALALLAILPRLRETTSVDASLDALRTSQQPDGSWGGDVYTTALAVRALALAADPARNPDLGTIHGRVLDGESGLALSGVQVSLTGAMSVTQLTDQDGRFQLTALTRGNYQLTLSRTDYVPLTTHLVLPAGHSLDLGTLALLQGDAVGTGTLRGQVTDAQSGAPLAGVSISAQGLSIGTDAAGQYQLTGLAPGPVTATARLDGYLSVSASADLAAGGVLIFSPQLMPQSGPPGPAALSGIITAAATGAPLAGVTVRVAGSTDASVQTGADGRYRIEPLASGRLDLEAILGGYDPVRAQAVVYDEAQIDFSPALYPSDTTPPGANSASISGLAVDSVTNLPLAGVTVEATHGELTERLHTDTEGRFQLSGIQVSEVELHLTLEGYRASSLGVLVTPLAAREIGQVRLRPMGIDRLLPDLRVSAIDPAARQTDPQTLAVSGSLAVEIANQGTAALTQPVDLVGYDDVDADGQWQAEREPLLGRTTFADGLEVGARATLTLPLAGELPFRDAPIAVWVDAESAVVELDEANNTLGSQHACQVTPAPLGAVELVEKWRWSGVTDDPSLADRVHVVNTVLVAQLSDDDQDGAITERDIPDLVFAAGNDDYLAKASVLVALSGDDGHELWRRDDLEASQRGAGAIGDLDGDGDMEIVVSDLSRSRLIALEHDGSTKWSVPGGPERPKRNGNIADGLVIVDLEGDGSPEIIQGRRVYDHQGNLLWTGAHDRAAGRNASLWGLVPIAADVDLDGSTEVIAGRSLYDAQGNTRWHRGDLRKDGYNAVGNFDADPEAEILLVGGGRLYLLEHSGETIWGPVALPKGGGRGGPPTVGDFDGDGEPEIGVAGSRLYSVFETDGSIKWTSEINDTTSASTGSSLFDFDADGQIEVVYADQEWLRIYAGATGAELVAIRNRSITATEYPVIADVDGDGGAEIIVVANWKGDFKGVRVFEPATGQWAATRPLWNQHSYHITNIDDDGRIPTQESPSWLVHNTYRLNAFLDRDPLAAADLSLARLNLLDNGLGQPFSLRVDAANGGARRPHEAVRVAFYQGDPQAGGQPLGELEVQDLPAPGTRELRLDGVQLASSADLYALIDPEGQIEECAEHNNTIQIPYDLTPARGRVSAQTDAASYGPSQNLALTATVTNTGSYANDYRLALRIEDAAGNRVTELAAQTLTALAPAATQTVTASWNSGTTLAGAYRLRVQLFDAVGSLLDEASAPFTLTAGDGPLVALRLTTDRARYHTHDRVTLRVLTHNQSANQLLTDTRLALEIRAPDGTQIHQETLELGDLVPGGQRDRLVLHDLVAAPEGDYHASVRLQAGGAQLAEAQAGFTVAEDPARALTGQVTVAVPQLETGETQHCTERLSHQGTRTLSALAVRHLLVDLVDPTAAPLEQIQETIDLAPGAERTWVRSIATDTLAPGDYGCVLQAELAAEWTTLGHDTFRLTAPPIDIQGTLSLGAGARLLALLDRRCRGGGDDDDDERDCDEDRDDDAWESGCDDGIDLESACVRRPRPNPDAERAFLAQQLDAAGWSYTLLSDASAFTSAWRGGGYGLALLQSGRLKLPTQVQRELVEAVFHGAGLVLAGDHDRRHRYLETALGIAHRGRLVSARGLVLSGAAPFAPASGDFARPVGVQRIELQGATSLGVYRDRHGTLTTLPAVTGYAEDTGRSLYFGFDLLSEATTAGASDGLFATLLDTALNDVVPSSQPLTPAAVVPVSLELTNRGIAVTGHTQLELPAAVTVVDAGGAVTDPAGVLSWPFDLVPDAELSHTVWLRLPEAEDLLTLTARIQTAVAGAYQDHRDLSLVLTPTRPQGLAAARLAMAGKPTYAWARRHLDWAAMWWQRGRSERALHHLVMAARALRRLATPEATQLRHWVANAIAEVGRGAPP